MGDFDDPPASEPTPGFTYAEVGATREPGRLPPPGYHLMRVRTRVGSGEDAFVTASRALMEWRLHRAVGVGIEAGRSRAALGVPVAVVVRLGPLRLLRAPCRVVWVVEEDGLAGWGYGTLPGHPVRGEESFLVERDRMGAVWLTVTAFSRPGVWYTRAAGSLGRAAQHYYARRCGRVMRRLLAPR
ncbi:DUF1990 family protein [Streptomyces spiramenti]|uniref:DUF1990 domain-containing protein n=1 Tax=Streptomyces spiramenti TaxID=2720606 RepID=A0ABX1ARM8_9ACTN|nr:DUF1990 domain-containing protein [Streptomyces spiramenti]NJP68980.1 DUF1990 domain-containing protein [Streptomyces spiramenti]